jgi:hypothetical protein
MPQCVWYITYCQRRAKSFFKVPHSGKESPSRFDRIETCVSSDSISSISRQTFNLHLMKYVISDLIKNWMVIRRLQNCTADLFLINLIIRCLMILYA